jgi:DNA-binding HxlR family transcriptional regulator
MPTTKPTTKPATKPATKFTKPSKPSKPTPKPTKPTTKAPANGPAKRSTAAPAPAGASVASRSARAASPATAARSQQRAKEAINAALELFNRRWVLRVLWELRGEAMNFRALQSACGDLSPTVLNQRLAELREAALVDSVESGYALTPLGRELIAAFEPLTAWAVRWHGQRR